MSIQPPLTTAITQSFGINPQNYSQFGLKGHNGIDYSARYIPCFAAFSGKVVDMNYDAKGYGNYLTIEGDGYGCIYAHLSAYKVNKGQIVTKGQLIAVTGASGNVTGPHLHFGIYPIPNNRQNGFAGYINPEPLFNKPQPGGNKPMITRDELKPIILLMETMDKTKDPAKREADANDMLSRIFEQNIYYLDQQKGLPAIMRDAINKRDAETASLQEKIKQLGG